MREDVAFGGRQQRGGDIGVDARRQCRGIGRTLGQGLGNLAGTALAVRRKLGDPPRRIRYRSTVTGVEDSPGARREPVEGGHERLAKAAVAWLSKHEKTEP